MNFYGDVSIAFCGRFLDCRYEFTDDIGTLFYPLDFIVIVVTHRKTLYCTSLK